MLKLSRNNEMKKKFMQELTEIESFCTENNMVYQLIDDQLIIITDISYWKIDFLPDWDCFVLYHGDYIPSDVNPETYVDAEYHHQKDAKFTGCLMRFLIYIRNHDRFRYGLIRNVEKMPRRTKKQKVEYQMMKKRVENYDRAIVLQMMSAAHMLERKSLATAV